MFRRTTLVTALLLLLFTGLVPVGAKCLQLVLRTGKDGSWVVHSFYEPDQRTALRVELEVERLDDMTKVEVFDGDRWFVAEDNTACRGSRVRMNAEGDATIEYRYLGCTDIIEPEDK